MGCKYSAMATDGIFLATAIGEGEESRNVYLSIIESSTCMTTTKKKKKKQKEESPSMAAPTPAKRTTRAAARAEAIAAAFTGSARTPPKTTMSSAANANSTTAPSRRTTRSQSKNKATNSPTPAPPAMEDENETTTTANTAAAAPPQMTPIWLLLVSSSSSSSSTAAIATYRILDRNGTLDNSLSTLTTSATIEARKKKRRKKEGGSRFVLTNCSGTATFSICPAATGTSSFLPEQTIATRRRPSLPICLLQPYKDQNNDSLPYSISSLQFQSLIEANYFSSTLGAVSRLMAYSSSDLGCRLTPSTTTSTVDLSVGSGPSGDGTTNQRHRCRQLANAAADEMLDGSHSTLAVDSGTLGDGNLSSQFGGKGDGSSSSSSSSSTNTTTTIKNNDDDDFYFVTSDDIGKIPAYVLLLLAQTKRSRLNASDISRRSSSVGLVPGTLGIQCRHCFGKRGSGTYFPPSANKLSRGSAPCLHSHLQRCEACPQNIKMALRREKNCVAEGANDGDTGGVGEHNQQEHWQLLLDRIGDESFDGGDDNSRAVVKAHLSKLLGVNNDGDGKKKEEPTLVKTRTTSQCDGDMNTKGDDLAEENKEMELEQTSAPTKAAAVTSAIATDLTAASSDEDMRPPTPDLEMEPFGFSFDAEATGKASSTADSNSRGTGPSPSKEDATMTTTPRNMPNPATETSTNRQEKDEDEDQSSEWGLSPIPHSDIDDDLIATPTRKFLSSLFTSDNCMTPFALL